MTKPPGFMFYVKDWLASERVTLMTGCAEGLYARLLALCWDNESLPSNEGALKALAPKHRRCWARCWPQVKPCFQRRGDRLVHTKLEAQRMRLQDLSLARAEAGRKGGAARSNSQAIAEQLPTHSVAVAVAVAEKSKAKPSAPTVPRVTWLTPFFDAWKAAYGGDPAGGELAKYLKPLTDAHVHGEVLDHWTRYLAATEARYASPARFAQTFGSWGLNGKRTVPLHEQPGVPDAYLTELQQAERRERLRAGRDKT